MTTQARLRSRGASQIPTMLDRRGMRRVASNRACSCNAISVRQPSPSRPGRIRDVSSGGIGLVLTSCLEPGTFLAIHIDDSGFSQPLRAKVVHATWRPTGWVIGCMLTRKLGTDEIHALI